MNKVNSVSSGPLTGVLKVRYKMINTILGELYNPDKGVDVFIDFDTFVKSLSKYQKYMNYLPFSGEEGEIQADLMSSFLTTLNHWKNFAKKWGNVRIIGFMNPFKFNKPVVERKHLKSYLIPHENTYDDMRYRQFTYYVSEAVKKVQTILKYVPNMYLLQPDDFDAYMIPNILDDYSKSGRCRIIISGNPLLTGYHNQPNTKVIYTKFKRKENYQLSDPLMIVQSFTKVDDDIMSTFCENKVFYNLLNVIVGDFDRGILGLTQLGITSFAYSLTRGVEKNTIRKDPKSVESTLPVIDPVYHDYVLKSYPLVDIDSHTKMIPESSIQNFKSNMIDLVDIDGLQSLSIDGMNLLELL